MAESALSNHPEYTVSEISGAVKRIVEDNFGYVRVRGEISGCKIAASGHAYLTLKDENAMLDAVCWKGTVAKLPVKPEDGLEVVCAGRITTYPGRSKYQMVIERMEPAGQGALMALLEQRKKQLAAEGLFAPERKKKLPYLPRIIGVVTSPTGAVIRDILHRIADRFPVHVVVWPVLVQGEGAAEQIAAAIRGFNELESLRVGVVKNAKNLPNYLTTPTLNHPIRPDLLIVARGGGSLEDLWAFNEEAVVRAAADSRIPLISAVGHETDTTLIDFVADVRAPTPTAAAEMAVPVRSELQVTMLELERRMAATLARTLSDRRAVLEHLARGLPKPAQLLEYAAQRLDDWNERWRNALPALLLLKRQRLQAAVAALRPQALAADLTRHGERVAELAARLAFLASRSVSEQEKKLAALMQMLESLNYQRVLERGFALVRNAKGQVIASAAALLPGEDYVVTFHDGEKKVKASSRLS